MQNSNFFTKTRWLVTILFTMCSIGQMQGAFKALSLPQSWTTTQGKSAYTAELGCTHNLPSDYSASGTKLKFNAKDVYLKIQLADSPDKLGYKIIANPATGNTTTTGQFDVLESDDDETYTTVKTYSSISNSVTTESDLQLKSSTVYIKFIYTTKTSGNVGLGTITISKASGTCSADPTVTAASNNGSFS